MNLATPASVDDAISIQQEMRHRVILQDDFAELQTIVGVDVGYDPSRNLSRAALVVLQQGELTASVIAFDTTPFPYVPGLLSFREVPVVMKALACLAVLPDMLFVDGQGIAHPRRLGIAAHLGVLTGLPAIGIAKKRLCGVYEEPDLHKGARSELIHNNEKIGTVLRSKERVKPLFISPGHRVSHETAVRLVEQYLAHHRLPEPTRLADILSKTPSKIPTGISKNLSLF
ncbi:MAG: deoxyribonuclease V [Pseudomonadota bacterium]